MLPVTLTNVEKANLNLEPANGHHSAKMMAAHLRLGRPTDNDGPARLASGARSRVPFGHDQSGNPWPGSGDKSFGHSAANPALRHKIQSWCNLRQGWGPWLMQSVLDSNDGQFFQHDGIVNGFCHDTIGVNGFSMVFMSRPLCSMVFQFIYRWTFAIEWMVLRLTIGINVYSMVHKKRKLWQNRGK